MEKASTTDIAKKYTDTMYANRDEVRRGLNTSLVDPFWNAILAYRSQYSKPVHLPSLNSPEHFVCNTAVIGAKCSETTSRLDNCLSKFLALDEGEKTYVREKCAYDILSYVGQIYGETLTDDFVATVISKQASNIQGLSSAKKKVIDFYDGYLLLGERRITIDEDFLVKLYVAMAKKEITSNYRSFDFNANDVSVVNREHNGVPYLRIAKFMEQLYAFLKDNMLPTIQMASIAYYYINYVKPFSDYNNEIALLVFKAIIGNDSKEQIGYLLPFEELLKHYETFQIDFRETVRGRDLTYVLVRILSYATGVTETFLDNCVNAKTIDLRREHAPKADENPLDQEKTVSEMEKTEKDNSVVKEKVGSVAVHTIESGLEEKDANKFEKFLLEKNPNLKKAQAHFYARHCTMGSFYTIQMYKKAERVVYETARTSMDALAEFGYYEKRQIKNKFVYTPVKIEGDKKNENSNS